MSIRNLAFAWAVILMAGAALDSEAKKPNAGVGSLELEELKPDDESGSLSGLVLFGELGEPIKLVRLGPESPEIEVDGSLDEGTWKTIPGVDQFVVTNPDTLTKPIFQTIVRAFYTDKGLYVGFDMEQPNSTLVRRFSGRDNGWLNRDAVSITLDTSGEGRYGYWMNLALGGNQTDGTVLPERDFSDDWDGAWIGATSVTSQGWSAELFLPWSQVAMPKKENERVIKAYVSRKLAHLDERWTIPALPFSQPFFMSALQPLILDSVSPKKQWSLFPFLSFAEDRVDEEVDSRLGADLFFRPSSNFQVTGTLSPDFGNVESDEAIVNLSAFETFFPEKRLFFKEGIEVFKTSRKKSAKILHTRRIGGRARAPDLPDGVSVSPRQLGQPVDLLGALKTVGSIGKVRYGLLGAFEDQAEFQSGDLKFRQDGSNYGVARFLYETKSEKGAYQGVGVISTLSSHPDEDALVQGLDHHFLSSSGKWKADSQLLYSDVDGIGSGAGGFSDLIYRPSRRTQYELSLSHYDDRLDLNDLGYLKRNNMSRAKFESQYRRYDLEWARKVYLSGFVTYEENGQGEATNKEVGGRTGIDLKNRQELRWDFGYQAKRIDDLDSRGNGSYLKKAGARSGFEYRTDSSRRVHYKAGLRYWSESQGGERFSWTNSVSWRPVDRLNIDLSVQYQMSNAWVLWQQKQDFTGFDSRDWRPDFNVSYFLSAKQQLRFSAQWVAIRAKEKRFYQLNPVSRRLSEKTKGTGDSDDFAISNLALQFRYQWEIAPLSELFVVYTLNGYQSVAESDFDDLLTSAYQNPSNEELVVKLRYRLGS